MLKQLHCLLLKAFQLNNLTLVQHFGQIQHDEKALLSYLRDTAKIFRFNPADHLRRRVNAVRIQIDDITSGIYDKAYLHVIDSYDDNPRLIGYFHLVQSKTAAQIDYRNDDASKINNTFTKA